MAINLGMNQENNLGSQEGINVLLKNKPESHCEHGGGFFGQTKGLLVSSTFLLRDPLLVFVDLQVDTQCIYPPKIDFILDVPLEIP